jgi:FkbM family methyltransferase
VLLARWVDPGGYVYSLEPVPETFKLLRHNLIKLQISNVFPIKCAASAVEGQTLMEIPKDRSGAENLYRSYIVGDSRPTARCRQVAVELKPLDYVLADILADITFVKIDVEGHELDVIRGANQLIMQSTPSMLIEVCTDPDTKGSSAQILFDILFSQDYQCYTVEDHKLRTRRTGDRAVDYFFLTEKHVSRLGQQGLLC